MRLLSYHTSLFVLLSIFLFTALISCSNQEPQKPTKEYTKTINDWHQQRISSLKENDSWLTLSGLYPLEEGTFSFGADSTNDIVFPSKAAGKLGTITKKGSSFYMDIHKDITVKHDGKDISSIKLSPDKKDTPTILEHESLLWYIIERRGNYYIRLKDTEHSNLTSFDGIDRFPISPDWKIKAVFQPFDTPRSVSIPDILGDTYEEMIYGTLEFYVDGQDYSLLPIGHPQKDEEFFIIFGDKTNGESTYSGGRYIYIPTPGEKDYTYIDFNKAYNPPCVFTSFATCPIPPPRNRLNIKVTAGEKIYEGSK
ncbi:DUF1684 domain-containing protein [Fodinibius halophilus]|uniref:DUF1684 domain-containing protein n=1 Tax=Fodinibius halophilus TaxID=1736908 RepID=A0A6M1SWL6_9BACT|nr:DUF1684 domain-containing protein [Fodinibius halophilus]NGP87946.1 DUF1684 domain-containing protein [Fodinibius halophilus]